ncbi:tRNA lysidine(34) synthetase TilS [Cognatilysobacter tabacisoli]|uniref:tRNA lysidine(34) synthetase TilS n=1 Tax=Cognatilysobacter tabacisoli TaxID=2315424 RepID=UPI000E6B4E1F|nr:tRNA lysidine(34) synthetase TilS [Lysobacter tabacisoli]
MPRPPAPRYDLNAALHDAPAAALCVGFSGGLDSTVLLHLLADDADARARGLRALHVHHGLHAEADRWAEACAATCVALDVPLTTVRVAVVPDGDGPEAAARAARHAAFAEALREDEVLALAQHRDDQAETFLLRALRGSGVDGLAAMRRWQAIGALRVWRPLLDVDREALLAYATHHRLAWSEDPSNADDAFDRNFLRQRVLPLLRERWPHAGAALAQSAAHCADAAALLADEDAHALARLRTLDPHAISRTGLPGLPAPRRARVLRAWIAELALPPLPARGVEAIERDLIHARADADARFAWHGAEVCAWRDLLRAGRVRAPLPPHWQARWDGRTPLPLPDGGLLALDGVEALLEPVTVRTRAGGERIALPGRDHSHALKHVLQDLGVPPWERAHLPLVVDARGDVQAAGDLVYAAPFDAWLRTHKARLRWTPPAP